MLTTVLGAAAAACGAALPGPANPIKLRKVLIMHKTSPDEAAITADYGFSKVQVGDCLLVEDIPGKWWRCEEKMRSLRDDRYVLTVKPVEHPLAALGVS